MKQTSPLIIQQGTRKAIIDGMHVSLLRKKNKKRDEGVWPTTQVPDPCARLYAAQAWVIKAHIDLPGM